jgi:hypothetical protein
MPLRSIGLTPTTHETCLYSGRVHGHRVLLLRQVDDFAVAATLESITQQVFDLIDDHLTIPLKRLGLVTLFNGIDIQQTQDYIKINCSTFLERICDKYLDGWLGKHTIMLARPTLLPQSKSFMTSFLNAEGDPSSTAQDLLSTNMGIKYWNGVGELIFALVTCRPDISYAVVKCAQATIAPHEVHYHAVKHILKYLYVTRSDGIYFWRKHPVPCLPQPALPLLSSSQQDILSAGRPTHVAMELHGYVDSDWATCPHTRRSLTGVCLRLAGGSIAYKAKLQPTVTQSSTEAEFMGASDFGKILLYVQSVLWDLGIPQHACIPPYHTPGALHTCPLLPGITRRTHQ